MPDGPMRWFKGRMEFIKSHLAALDERLKAFRSARHRRRVGVRFLRRYGPYNPAERVGFQPHDASRLVRAGVATYTWPYPAAGELFRDKWQRARTAPTQLWARLRDWHSGELYVSPPDTGLLVIGIHRPWLAMKFDAARRQVPEIGGKVLIGVLVAVLTAWIVKTWIAPG